MSSETSWVPDSCTLDEAERASRAAEFAGLFSSTVRGAERTGPTRLHLELEPSPEGRPAPPGWRRRRPGAAPSSRSR
jgi:hypothetical protein